jgi:hypothetical protein
VTDECFRHLASHRADVVHLRRVNLIERQRDQSAEEAVSGVRPLQRSAPAYLRCCRSLRKRLPVRVIADPSMSHAGLGALAATAAPV